MTCMAARLTQLGIPVALLVCAQVGAQPIGLWNTEDQQAKVAISDCGEHLCGELVWLAEPLDSAGLPKHDQSNPLALLHGRPVLGVRVFWDMMADADGVTWKSGRIYDPQTGKTYQGKLTLDSESVLTVRRFVGVPVFGRTAIWTRAATP